MEFSQFITALLFALAALSTIDSSTFQELKAKVSCLDCPKNFDFSDSGKCLAQLVGGPEQLYASRKNMISQILKAKEPNTFTISTPLSFSTKSELGSSKTVDLPLPPEWGLAPSSYHAPFFPII